MCVCVSMHAFGYYICDMLLATCVMTEVCLHMWIFQSYE